MGAEISDDGSVAVERVGRIAGVAQGLDDAWEAAEAAGMHRERRVYILRNARLEPEAGESQRRTLSIAGRAVSCLIATQGIGDLYRTYLNAQRDGVDYKLAFIPSDFKAQAKEAFDREYMQKLYDVGYELARRGYKWQKTPPAYESKTAGG